MRRSLVQLVLFLALASGAAAQSKGWEWADKADKTDPILPGVKAGLVNGDIATAGSSTVYPLSEAIANQFKKEGFQGNVTIDSIGTGAGFERFTQAGEIDVANASQKIKPVEVKQARSIGREPLELRIGTDALTVAVSAANTFADDVTMKELALLFSRAERWSDVRAGWPSQKIQRFIPGTDSGTFSFFVEKVFKRDKGPLLASANTQKSEDDNILIRGVTGSPYAVAFFGYAYFEENRKQLRALRVEGVAPGAETVKDESYPLMRPLYLYSTAKIIAQKPQVAAFLTYYLSQAHRVIGRVGYFPAPAADLDKAKRALLAAMKAKL